ncbi:MAG: DUF4139 domain-containing protein [Deltaproteobacteria bacterium]|nr:DUF4139 domain-containing protein [Deltaproteobacteria bacterium]
MSTLPIRKVVLYKHGVGFFERRGKVEGEQAVDLAFRTSEMNDVLKSLTVLDLSGGLISSVSYESTKPIDKQLEDVAIRLPEKNSLTGLLNQIKGAPVSVAVGSRTVEGVVTGIETISRKIGDELTWPSFLNLLVGGTTIESVPLMEIKKLELLDENVRRDLQHLLDILITSKKKDVKRLTIFARGDGEREVLASYVVEAPVWKTSYRLLLSEAKQPLIQGWALVDNTQDEDWDNVELTLVSGLPISFVHDLYSPRHKRRPVVEVQEEEAYAPPILEEADYVTAGAAELGAPAPAAAAMPAMMAPGGAPRARSRGATQVAPKQAMRQSLEKSVEVKTRTAQVGDLFQYELDNAVTVKRNQSALVPIVQKPFEGRRVAIYNPDVRAKNPMSAVLFKNTTGVTLEGGPVTVLDKGETYLGESMLDTLKPDEEKLVPFSVELGCRITTEHESDSETVHFSRVVDGTLELHSYRLEKMVYQIRSKLDKELELFIDHRFRPYHELHNTQKPEETTENYHRFKITVPAKKDSRFTVTEKGRETRRWALLDSDADTQSLWLSRHYIDESVHEQLRELQGVNKAIRNNEYWIGERRTQEAKIFDNQERLRKNLSVLGTSDDERSLRERYLKELNDEEDRLAKLRGEIDDWNRKLEGLRSQIKKMIAELRYESQVERPTTPASES